MPGLRTNAGIVAAALIGLGAASPYAQEYPYKTVRIITSAPGGGTDFAARMVAAGLTESLRQTVIVENRSGAIMSGQTVAKAPPDGYTLLLPGSSFWQGPLLQTMPYDPIKEFSPITITHFQPLVLVVYPSLPVKSVRELIDYAKAKPGELNYGSSAVGSSVHLAGALFTSMAKVNMVHVPYKGTSALSNAMLGGQVQLTFSTSGVITPHLKSGKLRGLGVSTLQPTALVPGMPTIALSGLPGYEASQRAGMFAPAKTPTAIINRLNREVVAHLKRPDIKEKFFDTGVDTVGSTAQELAAVMKSEMQRLGKVIKEAGIRAE